MSPTVTAQKQMEKAVHTSRESRVPANWHARFGKGGGGDRIRPCSGAWRLCPYFTAPRSTEAEGLQRETPGWSAWVVREAGGVTRGRSRSEALPTMWSRGVLSLQGLLTRMSPWLREKPLFEASQH